MQRALLAHPSLWGVWCRWVVRTPGATGMRGRTQTRLASSSQVRPLLAARPTLPMHAVVQLQPGPSRCAGARAGCQEVHACGLVLSRFRPGDPHLCSHVASCKASDAIILAKARQSRPLKPHEGLIALLLSVQKIRRLKGHLARLCRTILHCCV